MSSKLRTHIGGGVEWTWSCQRSFTNGRRLLLPTKLRQGFKDVSALFFIAHYAGVGKTLVAGLKLREISSIV